MTVFSDETLVQVDVHSVDHVLKSASVDALVHTSADHVLKHTFVNASAQTSPPHMDAGSQTMLHDDAPYCVSWCIFDDQQ